MTKTNEFIAQIEKQLGEITPGPWITGNNGVDVHRASSDFTEICTAFNRKGA